MPVRLRYSLLLLSMAGYILMGYFVERSNFIFLISIYSSLFLIYFYFLKYPDNLNFKTAIFAGLLFRGVLLFSFPSLSDDIYRFMWDGRIQQSGINPFDYTPRQLLALHPDTYLISLFPDLNSPDYYSVYPQILQVIFRITVEIAGENTLIAAFIFKFIILIFEAGTIYLLFQIFKINKLNPKLIYIYVLNPLVIIELTGNIHFEALMIFFLLLTAFLIQQNKHKLSIAALVLAIQAKLIPAILIPLLIKESGFWKTFFYGLSCLIIFYILSPYLWGEPDKFFNFLTSLKLYYGKFEFNGGIYSILSGAGWWISGFNPIYFVSKLMMGLTIAGFVYVYFKNKNFLTGMFWLFAIYLIFSAVVHPWYLTTLIVLCPFVNFRFALIWSALIPLTYITYQTSPYQQNYWIIAIEYTAVFAFLFYEFRTTHKAGVKNPSQNLLLV